MIFKLKFNVKIKEFVVYYPNSLSGRRQEDEQERLFF